MRALLPVNAVEKFVYFRVAMLNDRWFSRIINDFSEEKSERRFRKYSSGGPLFKTVSFVVWCVLEVDVSLYESYGV